MNQKQAEMQAALERVRDVAESWFELSESDATVCAKSGARNVANRRA